jgi:hypothetical protein
MPQATSETHQQALPKVSGLPLWPEEAEQEIGQLTALSVRTRPDQIASRAQTPSISRTEI